MINLRMILVLLLVAGVASAGEAGQGEAAVMSVADGDALCPADQECSACDPEAPVSVSGIPLDCSGHGVLLPNLTCSCFVGYAGPTCNLCAPNYYNYPTCTYCNAATTCSGNGVCSATGSCVCSAGFTGTNCSQCAANYYNYPICTYCNAATTCSGNGTCSSVGACQCYAGYSGSSCEIVCPPVAPDLDQDCDVDEGDLVILVGCAGGPAVPYSPVCSLVPNGSGFVAVDFDQDLDVDQDDFGVLQRCWSGANNAPVGGCDD